MKLTISAGDLELLRTADDAVLLGIILRSGRVLLAVSDRVHVPGHADWIRQQRLTTCFRGFSVVLKTGRITALIRQSGVNPEAIEYRLELDLVRSLERLLPLAEEYECLAE